LTVGQNADVVGRNEPRCGVVLMKVLMAFNNYVASAI